MQILPLCMDMKQPLPDKLFSAGQPKKFGKVLRPELKANASVLVHPRFIAGALAGLMLCTMGVLWLTDSPLLHLGKAHHLQGTVFVDPNADQRLSENESLLPFVKLNLYADLNDNRKLDPDDLAIGSCLTNEQGAFELNVTHGRTYMTRVKNPQHEAQENLATGSVGIALPLLSLGGDDNITGLTALRFDAIDLPADAHITEAFIRLKSVAANPERPLLWIRGEINPLQPAFEETPGNLSERIQTRKDVLWECQPWEKDQFYRSPDLSDLITEIIKTGNWQHRDAITLMIEGKQGIKEAYSATTYAPQLVVHYDLPKHDYLLEIDPAYAPDNGLPRVKWLAFDHHTGLTIPYPGNPPICFGRTQDQRMASFNRHTGMSAGFPPSAQPVSSFTHLVVVPEPTQFFALENGKLGTVQLPEGTFHPFPLQGSLPTGLEKFTALAVHPFTGQIWALTHNQTLLQIDPRTGEVSPPQNKKIRLKELSREPILQMVYHTGYGLLFYLQADPSGAIYLWQIDPEEGNPQSLGPLTYQSQRIDHIVGMSVLPNDRLSLITGFRGAVETQNMILQMDPMRMEVVQARPYPNPLKLEICGCHVPSPHQIQGLVFEDLNGNGKKEERENAYPGVNIDLFIDQNGNHQIDPQDHRITRLLTNEQGQYLWQSYDSESYLLRLDTSSLPPGIVLTSEPIQTIDFRGFSGGGRGPAVSFNATHKSRIAPLNWVRLKVRPQESHVVLNWSTSTEVDLGQFFILRSTDGIGYETIGRVPARGPSEQLNQYEFLDRDIMDQHFPVVAYRIRRTSPMGEAFSEVVKLSLLADETEIQLETAPGTHRPLITRYRTRVNGVAQLRVINLSGKVVFHREVISGSDLRQLEIPNQGWRAGIYYIQLETNQLSRMKKIVVQ